MLQDIKETLLTSPTTAGGGGGGGTTRSLLLAAVGGAIIGALALLSTQQLKQHITEAAVFHSPSRPYAYSVDKKTIHLRLRTKKFEVSQVVLFHKDPYAESSSMTSMVKSGYDELFDYWEVSIQPPYKRCEYTFILSPAGGGKWPFGGRKLVYYNENGFHNEHQKYGHFKFPFICPKDIHEPPSWVRETVWYQIFPERFGNGDPSLNPAETEPWGATPTRSCYFGGDFQGVIDHIDYLSALGINGVYFTPIFKAQSNHKYDTIDYLEIDPQFGTKETFKKLVNLLHERGIRVMLDCVFNHSGDEFPQFVDFKKNQEKSIYKDWFCPREFPLSFNPPNYDCFAFWGGMPKLNTSNPETRKYLIQVATYWIKHFDIDGWRLDVANEVDLDFWREFCSACRAEKEEFFILGELWHNSMNWIGADLFDSTMNYPLSEACYDLFIDGGPILKFVHQINRVLHWYPSTVHLFNLLSSHDTRRILTRCKNDEDVTLLAYAFLLIAPGTPSIYYGDEIGMEGGPDPDCRRCMEWSPERQNQHILSTITQLIKIRRKNKPLTHGSINFTQVNEKTRSFVVERVHDNQKIIAAFNLNSSSVSFHVPGRGYDLLEPVLSSVASTSSIKYSSVSIIENNFQVSAKSFRLFAYFN